MMRDLHTVSTGVPQGGRRWLVRHAAVSVLGQTMARYASVRSHDLLLASMRDAVIVPVDARPTDRVLAENRLGLWR